MDCLSIICLSSLFVEVGSGYQHVVTPPAGYQFNKYDRSNASPYLGEFSVGMQREVTPQLTLSLYYRHESMPTLGDVGVDAFWSTLTWRPFGGR